MIDYYAILEVHPTASIDVIKKAYITLAKKYHPDTTQLGIEIAAEKMAQLNEAYEILKDASKRQAYDEGHSEAYTSSVYAQPDNQSAYELANEVLLKQCSKYTDSLMQAQDAAAVHKLWIQFQDATTYTYKRLQETNSLHQKTQQNYEACLAAFAKTKNSFPSLTEDGKYVKKQILLPITMYNELVQRGVDINQCIKEALLAKLKQ